MVAHGDGEGPLSEGRLELCAEEVPVCSKASAGERARGGEEGGEGGGFARSRDRAPQEGVGSRGSHMGWDKAYWPLPLSPCPDPFL